MIRAQLLDALLTKPPQQIHLIMDRDDARRLRDILVNVHTGEFYQELVRVLGGHG
jgi:hypothetical protein